MILDLEKLGLEIEATVTTADERLQRRNDARDAVVEVLQRHGFDIPGVADLCAGAALKAAGVSLDC